MVVTFELPVKLGLGSAVTEAVVLALIGTKDTSSVGGVDVWLSDCVEVKLLSLVDTSVTTLDDTLIEVEVEVLADVLVETTGGRMMLRVVEAPQFSKGVPSGQHPPSVQYNPSEQCSIVHSRSAI